MATHSPEAERSRVQALHAEFLEAESLCRSSLDQDPDNPDLWNTLGVLLLIQSRYNESIPCFEQALKIDPQNAEAYKCLGDAHLNASQPQKAEEYFLRALEIAPRFAEARAGLAGALLGQGRNEESRSACSQALQIDPDLPEAHFYLANLERERGSFDLAERHYQRAIQLQAIFPEAYVNLGLTLQSKELYQEALDCFEEAIRIDPECVDAHFNQGFLYLLLGDYERGLAKYEWRLRKPESPQRHFEVPRWDGSCLQGKRILLYADQGFGDTILFCRYATKLKELGATVYLECQPALSSLLQTCPGIDKVLPIGSELPDFDCFAALASLPFLLRVRLDSIPSFSSYLSPPGETDEKWRKALESFPGPRVGICWKTNPNTYGAKQRSTPISYFAKLADELHFPFFSLQKGAAEEELRDYSDSQFIKLGPALGDFSQTAAAIANLDLVLTVDTAIAHLAAALGKPTWVLLHDEPDWKWLLEGEKSPYYPSVRIFRMEKKEGWQKVFEQVAQELSSIFPPKVR